MKKIAAATLCAAMLLTACSGAAGTEGGSGDSDSRELVLSTYGLSEDISAEEVYAPFEEQFGCKIVTETGSTNERYTKLSANSQSNIDVIELAQAMTAQGISEGLFEPIDLSKIENSQYLVGSAKTLAEEGQGIAYTINSIGIIYNPDAIDIEITGYDDLWDPSLTGMVAIPDITTTFGPAMVYVANDHAGGNIEADKGEAAFKALEELKPNLVKSYAKSSDLINMFTSGEVAVAVVGDFGVPTILAANPNLIYFAPEGTYANFNMLSIPKNAKNKELAYEYINYRLSKELQTKTAPALNEAPTNSQVELTPEQSVNMTYGETAENARVLNYTLVNEVLSDWIDQWNRIINS